MKHNLNAFCYVRVRSMKFLRFFLTICIVAVGLNGCNSDEGVALDNEVNEFVWLAMNQFYYWQNEVPGLSDDKRTSRGILNTFLNEFETPEALFSNVLHPDDRFSWIVSDYETLEASFQGISKSFGYELRILRITSDGDDLLAYVEYVVPDGPADNAGVVRGDVFTKVNDTQLTIDNYISLLFESESYTITLSSVQDGSFVDTNQQISLTSVELQENPILVSDVIDLQGTKVGYLMYNQFVNNNAFHRELNDVFGTFNNEGISDFVLDLRYNGGGSLTTSRILASMIYGGAADGDVLGSIVYNNKLSDFNTDLAFLGEVPIFDEDGNQTSTIPMNRLNLNRIFVLVSGSSASASEFVIAGLLPFMDVTLIGTTTVGKNVGSVTLYDSEDFLRSSTLNPNHRYAIQPIISQLANSEGFTDYIGGLNPDIEVNERDFLGDLRPLGDTSEQLLAEALAIISGSARVERYPKSQFLFYDDSGLRKKHINSIHIEKEFIPNQVRHILAEN